MVSSEHWHDQHFRATVLTNTRVLNAGRVRRSDPKRKYTYALLDPVDEPYAIFRYHLLSTGK